MRLALLGMGLFLAAAANAVTTLSVSATSVAPGANVTATWSGIVSPTSTDWLGMYTPEPQGGSGRGRARSPGGTNNPGKYWKEDPKKPGWGWQTDPSTGKKIYKRRPPYITPKGFNVPMTIWMIITGYCDENPEDPACAIVLPPPNSCQVD
jgi:hypothetical protein